MIADRVDDRVGTLKIPDTYPKLADAVQLTHSGTIHVFGSYDVVIPASTITQPFAIDGILFLADAIGRYWIELAKETPTEIPIGTRLINALVANQWYARTFPRPLELNANEIVSARIATNNAVADTGDIDLEIYLL